MILNSNDIKKGPDLSGPFLVLANYFNLFLFITNLYNQEFQIMRILHAPNNRVIA